MKEQTILTDRQTDRQTDRRITADESRAITIIRMAAMFLIILCHYVNFFDNLEPLSQFFNVGVPIFFIISGFLYGQKDISKSFSWYKKQYVKIVVPLYVYYFLSTVLLIVLKRFGELSLIGSAKVLLNLQGLVGGSIGNVESGHLWFITFILICYLLTPLLQKAKGILSLKKVFCILAIASVAWAIIVININAKYFIVWLSGVFSYIFSYYFGAFWKRNRAKFILFVSTAAMILSLGMRLGIKYIVDSGNAKYGTIYDCVIVPYTHCVLGFWIFITIYYLCKWFPKTRDFIATKFRFFDVYSYYIYIVHYMFVVGVFRVSQWTNNKLIITLAFVGLTAIYSVILKFISTGVFKLIKPKNKTASKAE